jgi:uncharacterized membrane protein
MRAKLPARRRFAKLRDRPIFGRMDAAPARLHLDEVIVPHRSLSRQGFIVLIAILVSVNLALGTLFVILGAPPIPVFLGLDLLAVIIAFRVSYAQANRRERVQVTADDVKVTQELGARSDLLWRSPTAFTRVLLEEPHEDEARVRLALSNRRMTIGRALGMEGRRKLARKVEDAIRAAKRERYPG